MKIPLTVFGIILSVQVFSQDLDQLNAYKYAIVNTLVYENNEVDKYQIGSNVRKHLFQKGIQVFNEDPASWPADLFENKCLAFVCDIKADDRMFAKYHVTITFSECNGSKF